MSSADKLAGVRSKIKWAEKRILDLDVALKAFDMTRPHEIAAKHDSQTNKLVYYVAKVGDIPDDIPLITGEVIHCLRSALDHLAYRLWEKWGRNGDERSVYFPIFKEPVSRTKIARKIEGMPASAVTIFDRMQAYKGGNGHDLWVLNTLDRTDKHRLLITAGIGYASVDIRTLAAQVTAVLGVPDVPPTVSTVFRIDPAHGQCPLKVGDVLLTCAPFLKFDKDVDPTFEVAIHEVGVLEREPVLIALQKFVQITENVVNILSPLV